MEELDLIIVGAGAAGIHGARLAQAQGLHFKLLEARGRIGGRAYTDYRSGYPLDHGCHWLHTADLNPLTRLADQLGRAYRQQPGHYYLHGRGQRIQDDEQAAWTRYWQQAFQVAEAAGAAGRDVAMAEVIPDDPRWRPTFDSFCAAVNGLEPPEVSTLDCYRYVDTGLNYPVKDGYGALIAALGADLPVSTDTPVERIRWSGPRVQVETPKGQLRAQRLLLTVSTGVLAADGIRFDPPLPAWKQAAIHGVPMGQANKVMFRLRELLPGVAAHTTIRLDRGSSLSLGLYCHEFGRPLVSAYLAGRSGEILEYEGALAMEAFARECLVDVFGSGVNDLIDGVQCTAWGGDPYSRGAYSLARPGEAHCREQLAISLEEKLYFAGEATSLTAFGTAHGAWESAQRVFEELSTQL